MFVIIGGSDYTIPDSNSLLLIFTTNVNRSCFDIGIIDNNITESAAEIFTITLPNVTFPGLNVAVNTMPTTVTILDNDGEGNICV